MPSSAFLTRWSGRLAACLLLAHLLWPAEPARVSAQTFAIGALVRDAGDTADDDGDPGAGPQFACLRSTGPDETTAAAIAALDRPAPRVARLSSGAAVTVPRAPPRCTGRRAWAHDQW